MAQHIVVMKSQLSEIDKVYGRLHKYATLDEKLKYCQSLLQRTEKFLADNAQAVTDHIYQNSKAIIEATANEIESLSN